MALIKFSSFSSVSSYFYFIRKVSFGALLSTKPKPHAFQRIGSLSFSFSPFIRIGLTPPVGSLDRYERTGTPRRSTGTHIPDNCCQSTTATRSTPYSLARLIN